MPVHPPFPPIKIFGALLFFWCLCSNIQAQEKSQAKGYYGIVQAGSMIHNPRQEEAVLPVLYHSQFIQGYQWNQYIQTGLSLGLIALETGYFFPISFDLRGDFLQGRISPHYFFQAGFHPALFPEADEENGILIRGEWRNNYSAKGGTHWQGGAGLRVRNGSIDYLFTLGYSQMSYSESFRDWGGLRINRKQILQRLSLQAGIQF